MPITKLEKERINRLYNKGMSISQVAGYTGFSRSAVQKYIDDPRPAITPRLITLKMGREINEMRERGMKMKDIAAHFHIGETTIWTYLRGVRQNTAIYTIKDRIRMNGLYEQGYNMQAIADIFGCGYGTVARAIWRPREKGARTNVKG